MSQGYLHTFPNEGTKSGRVGQQHRYLYLLRAAHGLINRHKLVALLFFGGLLLSYSLASMLYRPSLDLTFSQATVCTSKFTLFPGVHKAPQEGDFMVSFSGGVSVFGATIGSSRVCATPTTAVKPMAVHTVPYGLFGNDIFSNKIFVAAEEYPVVKTDQLNKKTISAVSPFRLELSRYDEVFSYELYANNSASNCEKEGQFINCYPAKHQLKQGVIYKIKLQRSYAGAPVETLFEDTIKTAEPLTILSTSIPANATVYEPVTELMLTASSELMGSPSAQVTVDGNPYTGQMFLHGNQLKVSFNEPLPWRSEVKIVVTSLEATSGAVLDTAYELAFTTAGGPKIVSTNVTEIKMDPGNQLELTFDQDLASDQPFASQVTITGPQGDVAAEYRVDRAILRVTPTEQLRRCASYIVRVSEKLENPYKISGDSSWEQAFKTSCGVVSSIGTSVQGRQILAHSFGAGSDVVVYVGGMHGTEASGTKTLNEFIDALERDFEKIPSKRRIVVIPNSNPDGIAHGTRTNANGVDLNRNFPADDWQSEVHMPGGIVSPTGGGVAALSEPESQALAAYIDLLSPRLVLTYHAVASIVIGNGSGDSNALANIYASKAGYAHAYDAHADETFGYPTTGEFEGWLHDNKNIPALLVEQSASTRSVYRSEKAALWHMATLL
jgi:murein peptide amidase A